MMEWSEEEPFHSGDELAVSCHRVGLTGQIFAPPSSCALRPEWRGEQLHHSNKAYVVHGAWYMIQQTRTSRHAAFQTRKADGRQRGLCFGRQHSPFWVGRCVTKAQRRQQIWTCQCYLLYGADVLVILFASHPAARSQSTGTGQGGATQVQRWVCFFSGWMVSA